MKISVFCFFAIATLFTGIKVNAQYIHDYQGKAYVEQSYTDVQGEPYLISNWVDGKVEFAGNKLINAKLKYDLVKDELLFQNPKDSSAMVFVNAVIGFSLGPFKIDESNLSPLIFTNGYPAVEDQTPVSFYQVIADGKIKLLKRYRKHIRTDQAFNSATVTKTFEMMGPFYYILTDNKIARFKPTQKNIVAALSDKTDAIQAFIKANKIDFKSDGDLAKLFTYYNSL
jgi:hypothetical protein